MTAPQQQMTVAQAATIAAGLVAGVQTVNVVDSSVEVVSTRTAASIAAITAATKNMLRGLWLNTNPYDDKSVTTFTAQANTILVAAQKTTGQTAAAGQSAMLRAMGINATVVPKLDDDIRVPHATASEVTYGDTTVSVKKSDSTNEQLLQRPARGFRWRESVGDSPQEAEAFSITRLDDVIDGNLVVAQRDAEHQVLNAPLSTVNYTGQPVQADGKQRTRTGALIVGYRRIIHPEFSAGGVCGLCIAASDRVYRVETLRPIHLRCKCTSAPVTAKYDPGLNLNSEDLGRLYDDAGSTSVANLKRTRYTVTYNELGPVLVPAHGELVPHFTPKARVAPRMVNQDVIPHNRNPEKGRTAPTFVGGDGKRTAAQKAAANKNVAGLLASIKDV